MLSILNPVARTAQIWDATGLEQTGESSKMDVKEQEQQQSLYVEIFKSMQDIVLKREKFLFSPAEQACLERLNTLSYAALYLLIRLCLCKRGKWHTLRSLEGRYKIEIGGEQHISNAINELCGIVRAPPPSMSVKKEEHDIIDLTMDEDDAAPNEFIPVHTPNGSNTAVSPISDDELHTFAADDTAASITELLACLSNEELKLIGKEMKVTKAGQKRPALMEAILSHASSQSTLAFPLTVLASRSDSIKSKGQPMRQVTLSFARDGKKQTQTSVVRNLVLKSMGRCIRVNPAIFTLFDRLNLVFFRSTVYSSSLLLPALLTAFRKRQYVTVGYVRTANIFPSRQALLDYEEALRLESRVDEIFGGDREHTARPSVQKATAKSKGKTKAEEAPSGISSRVEDAKVVRGIWESVYDRWKALVACKDEQKVEGLERFDCGHVLTRIAYKGAEALSILKEYDAEMEVLEALLAQKKWRRGRRGAWYDRLALVLMTHCKKTQETLETAMEVVIRGLEDELTYLTYRPRLERRLTRLEKMLKIPADERHKCEGQLKKAEEVYIEGVRIKTNRAASVIVDMSARVKTSPFSVRSESETPFTIARASTQLLEREINKDTPKNAEPAKGKTRWIGREGEEVSVEQLALEYYQDLGYKGFHSEGRIVSTIFGLLFWDIIFAPVPGAFETPYQSAPLDIHEDSFYSARKGLIEQRLGQLEDGRGRELLGKVDDKERPARTWCIGVDWDFEREDLLEIVDCLGGRALAIICQTICEDYGQWRGGVPDLFVWNAETRECTFVEVKSPNDTLQENQKVWIDVLIGSETPVDLCLVAEKGAAKTKRKKRPMSKKPRAAVDSSDTEDVELESEDEDVDLLDRSQEPSSRRTRVPDPDDYVPLPVKKRAMEVEVVITPRKKRKPSTA